MPPKSRTQHRPSPEASPRPRHKSTKPKFDIGVEAPVAEAPVAWVYRAEEPAAPAYYPREAPRQTPQPESSPENPFLMVGRGFFLVGLGTLNIVSSATYAMIAAPFRIAKWMLTSE